MIRLSDLGPAPPLQPKPVHRPLPETLTCEANDVTTKVFRTWEVTSRLTSTVTQRLATLSDNTGDCWSLYNERHCSVFHFHPFVHDTP